MKKLIFKANPLPVNTVDEVKPGDVLSFGDKDFMKIQEIFLSLRDGEIKVKWSEKHPEGVMVEEGNLPEFRKRVLTLKETCKASVKMASVNWDELTK